MKLWGNGKRQLSRLLSTTPPPTTPATPPPPSSSSPSNELQITMDIVRKQDYEHFLCSLLLPFSARRSAMALRAFNVEVSRSAVSPVNFRPEENGLARMRLTWWRSIIDDIFAGRKIESPIGRELAVAVKKHNLTKGFLLKSIDARQSPRSYNSLIDVEQGADETFSIMNMLILEAMGSKSVECDHAASHLGRSEGLIALIRSIPILRHKRICLVPSTTLAKFEITQQAIIESTDPAKLKDVIHEIASSAHVHTLHCEKIVKTLPKDVRSAFLPLTPAKLFLERLKKYDFDLENPRTLQRSPLLPMSDDEGPPPLEDMTDYLQRLSLNQTLPNLRNKENSIPVIGGEETQDEEPQNDKVPGRGKGAPSPTIRKEQQGYGGMKKGFLFGGAPGGGGKKKRAPPKITELKANPQAKEDELKLKEVQEKISEANNFLSQNSNEWVTDDLLTAVSQNEKVASKMSNPQFMAAFAEFQADPTAAMRKYGDNPEMKEFIQSFAGILGAHFTKLGEKQGN